MGAKKKTKKGEEGRGRNMDIDGRTRRGIRKTEEQVGKRKKEGG